jgi:inosine-uridine nucleoside N-ribohydrolase/catechol 2,3-dioxygenase-like lactoylglutathione lyase family enzyme
MNYKKPIWIDTDISLGQEHAPGFYKDIDDGLAMIQLFNSRTVDIKGVSTTFGNTDTDSSFRIATELVSKFGPDGLQVYHGSSHPIKNPDKLPVSDGSEALAAALRKERLTILTIGSATNIGVVIKQYPELVDQIERLVAMAGSRTSPKELFIVGPKQEKPFPAMNFEADEEAWRIILASNVPITFVPFHCSKQVHLTVEDSKEVGTGAETGKYLEPYMERWAKQWVREWGAPGFIPFDALASGYLLVPDMFTVETLPVCIKKCHNYDEPGILEKLPFKKNYLLVNDEFEGCRRVQWCSGVNQEFKPYLISTLKGGWNMAVEALALSHVNIVVDDLDKATEFYGRALGFMIACNKDGKINFPHYKSPAFAKDAGFLDGEVDVDIRFLKHPQAGLYLELMVYHYPEGSQKVPEFNINDMGGPRHVAMEVTDLAKVFEHLKEQPDVQMINPSPKYGPPLPLGKSDVAFFYWRDPYGVIWEMETGRPIGYGAEITG